MPIYGGTSMNERDLQVLEQYPFSVNASWRVRGAFLLDSSEGRLLIREFSGSAAKVEKEQQLLAHLKACGHRTDQIIADAEGRLVTVYREYLNYLVKESPEGRECDTRSESEILAAVSLLAALHRDMKQVPGFERKDVERLAGIDAREELARHNQELRKIYTFVRRKNRKNEFEAAYIQCFSSIREEAERAERLLKETSYEVLRKQALEEGQICHGEYIHHNLLVAGGHMTVINFEKFSVDVQMNDLYLFMRKVLEKQNYDARLGRKMLITYSKVRPLREEELEYLGIPVCCTRKNSGNWQITTIIPTKHGFRASIWRNLRNSSHKGKKEFLFHMNYYIIIPEITRNQGGSCAKWTIKQSMRNGFPIRILTRPQKLNCVRSQMMTKR